MRLVSLLIQGLILSFILVLFTTTSAFAEKACVYVLSSEADRNVIDINAWKKNEKLDGVPEEHQKRMHWAGKPGEPTEIVTLAIHGLFNSPRSLNSLQTMLSSNGQNVMMSRLAGHFESDFRRMKYHIKWREWLEQTDAEFRLARRLGKKVLLVGHSTGALFATWLALRYPNDVAGLILFSPAYGVHPLAQIGAWISDLTGFTPMKKDGQILYGHAGFEVNKAAAAYRRYVDTQTKKDKDFISETLSHIPIWMGNTHYDIVIQTWKTQKFIKLAQAKNPQLRTNYWTPLLDPVLHDNITTPLNGSLPQILVQLDAFVKSLKATTEDLK